MCGIIGYVGVQPAKEILLHGLADLEYRGYDSAGLALFGEDGIQIRKAKGGVEHLKKRCANMPSDAHCGIGHTRWATHGAPSDRNAHPHSGRRVTLVHNGIIENHAILREFLQKHGYSPISQTDTEIAALLIDYHYQNDPVAAIRTACAMMRGSYAFGILFHDRPGEIYAIRRGSPLLAAIGEDGYFIASDLPAVLPYTKRYLLPEEEEIVLLQAKGFTVLGRDDRPIERAVRTAEWEPEEAKKDGFAHFMCKEIHEQPPALHRTLQHRICSGLPHFGCDGIPDSLLRDVSCFYIIGCGSAMHAGMIGKAMFEQLAQIPTEVEIASEFRYRPPLFAENAVCIAISQSGETADTLAALQLARASGIPTLAIVNAAGSSIAREADHVMQTHAGPEIAVASTKAYTTQLGLLCLLAVKTALLHGTLSTVRGQLMTETLLKTGEQIKTLLERSQTYRDISRRLATAQNLFYIGRGIDRALAYEGALKLKEISYLHAEAAAAGELKHGSLSLITEGVPVVALATQQALFEKTCSNIREVAARGAVTVLICRSSHAAQSPADITIPLPDLPDLLMPFAAAIPLQLLAYHTACACGCNVDKPRNLAKSVTVE